MRLVVFVLNKEELLERVLEAYVEAGITGATILDSEGMGHFLTYEVPLFADFKEFMKGNKPYNKTILSVVEDDDAVPRLYRLLDEVCGGMATPGTGIFFTLPIDFAAGLVGMPDGGVTSDDGSVTSDDGSVTSDTSSEKGERE
ncbi:MAG: hypothetical protein ACOCYC_01480 [bacterium]